MRQLLKKYFGYDEFRPLQAEIIEHIMAGNDALVLMPTGGGKSLCYQLPALAFPGVTLVISPLIALMKDQVDALRACGVAADYLNSSLSSSECSAVCERLKSGKTKLLYVAPERLASDDFRGLIANIELSLIAIDEAHCISEWGHDFRPDYRQLATLKRDYTGVPIVALTATATPRVKDDIVALLGLAGARVFVSSFDRPNLQIKVLEKKQTLPNLFKILAPYKRESVIIYCFSRQDTEKLATELRRKGYSARAYHAGLSADERREVQELFIRDSVNIVTATIAFGMGIDKSNVRLVVHYTFPKTLESYYQEIGRAGRDGLPSECLLLYAYADARKHEFFISQMHDQVLVRRAQSKLSEMMSFCEIDTCRKRFLLEYFGEQPGFDNCASCDICRRGTEVYDATEIAQKILSAILRCDQMFGRNHIIDVLLGRRTQKVKLNSHDQLSVFGIAKDYTENSLATIFNQLHDRGLLRKTDGRYPLLCLTNSGADFLRSNLRLSLSRLSVSEEEVGDHTDPVNAKDVLFERLRALRRQLAKSAGVPPFIIFDDATLRAMCKQKPSDEAGFLEVPGVGIKKWERYGQAFLTEIEEFETEKASIVTRESAPSAGQAFYQRTLELARKKTPLSRMAKAQKLKEDTIVSHLEKIIDAGELVDLAYLKLPLDRFETMRRAFEICGDERLKPVYEYLEGVHTYPELKLARILLLSS